MSEKNAGHLWYERLVSDLELARTRLQWVEEFRGGLLRLLGDDVVHHTIRVVPSPTDPLKFMLRLPLLRTLDKPTRSAVRQYMRQLAERHNCELPRIEIGRSALRAEIFTKHRIWKPNE